MHNTRNINSPFTLLILQLLLLVWVVSTQTSEISQPKPTDLREPTQGNCPNAYITCEPIGHPEACCPANSTCGFTEVGSVGCCPRGTKCVLSSPTTTEAGKGGIINIGNNGSGSGDGSNSNIHGDGTTLVVSAARRGRGRENWWFQLVSFAYGIGL